MRKLRITIAFRGTNYHGSQVQQNAVSVTQVFQDTVEAVFGVRYDVKGCSRTDSGVHARAFVLSMDFPRDIPCQSVLRALNINLPGDIAVLDCADAPENFHPRYDATAKRYSYRIWNEPVKNPFEQDTAWHISRTLDAPLMQQGAACFVGTHDFGAFCAAGSKITDRVRTITDCTVTRQGGFVVLSITGDGFLYNMVRIITGTLVMLSDGKRSLEQIPEIISSGDRHRAGATAPAHGLWLEQVFYES